MTPPVSSMISITCRCSKDYVAREYKAKFRDTFIQLCTGEHICGTQVQWACKCMPIAAAATDF